MTRTLWGSGADLDAVVADFTAGDDRRWDQRLLAWDVVGTIAHVEGLTAAGLLSATARDQLVAELRHIFADVEAGLLKVTDADEDAHTALETRLVQSLGEVGEKVHTGRSRNDQVLAALSLYAKHRLLEISEGVLEVVTVLTELGRRHADVVMPGYTHLRRAMPSTVALWAGGYAESLLDDLGVLTAAANLADVSPLGSAAGYGVPLPLKPELVAELLGFDRARLCVTAAQHGRGKLEAVTLSSLWTVARDLGALAWDVVLFASDEFGFFRLPRDLATGSSIMPQKRNPDVFELLRGRAGVLCGLATQAMAVAGGLPGGYHRDLQLVKGPLMEGLDIIKGMLVMAAHAVPRLEVDREACERAVTGEIFATDETCRRVREGQPFRTAYRAVAAEVAAGNEMPALSPHELLAARRYAGGAGDPGLLLAIDRAADIWRERLGRRRSKLETAVASLTGGEVCA
jgi:argininosuccinate lyase